MSLAADIAAKLGRTHPEGHNHLTECPLCCGRLSLRDGETGKLLVTCWGGCDNLDILDELRKLGMFSGAPMAPETEEARQQRQAAHHGTNGRRITYKELTA